MSSTTSDYVTINNCSESEFIGFIVTKVKLSGLIIAESNVSDVTLKHINNRKNLKTLTLTNNGIGKIGNGTFTKLSELQYLTIEHNNLTAIEIDAFKELSKVLHLSLTNNKLADVFGIFDSLVSVKCINLCYNQLKYIDHSAFKNNQNLKRLLLFGNKLTTIQSVIDVMTLQSLNVRQNCITSIENTKEFLMDLTWNHLEHFFIHANSTFLDLSHNRLKYLKCEKNLSMRAFHVDDNLLDSWKCISSMKIIRSLMLSNNKYTSITYNDIKYLTNMTYFRFYGNRILNLDLKGMRICSGINTLEVDYHGKYRELIELFPSLRRVVFNYTENISSDSVEVVVIQPFARI